MINLIYIRHIFLFFHLSIISHESFACNACWECLTYCCPGTTQNNTTVASQESTIIPNDTSIEFSAIPTTENEVELNISNADVNHTSITKNSPPLLMGVEIETSAIKLSNAIVSFHIITKKK